MDTPASNKPGLMRQDNPDDAEVVKNGREKPAKTLVRKDSPDDFGWKTSPESKKQHNA